MCYSATVSFSVGIPLIATGLYSAALANKFNKKYLLFSLIPFFFGIQQLLEGQVWLNLYQGLTSSTLWFSYAYLFFAFFFWPAYLPMSVYFIENQPTRKRILSYLMITGLILGVLLYLPLAIKLIPVIVTQVYHSICYETYQSPYLSRPLALLYAVVVILPMFISTNRALHFFGVLSLISLMISYVWLLHAFTSIWCFAQAVISLGVVYILQTVRSNRVATVRE